MTDRTPLSSEPDPGGTPRLRGEADYYYGRQRRPHRRVRHWDENGVWYDHIALTDPAEMAEYNRGYDTFGERKDWG